MSKQILFIQGAGEGGYEAVKELGASLQAALGEVYMISSSHLSFGGWLFI